ncbi:MAG: 3-hydroxyacyl-CoA dehydrogenase [Limnochordaceae bacterium]|nr:3-hydroxyacyl-CoA dehydrogenase [Limnochordaceae bacterium]
MDLQGHSAIVTGGASGLGEATVRRLIRMGARVVIADVNAAAGEALAERLGHGAAFVPTDVTDEASVQRAVDRAAGMGPLSALVNCAGVAIARRVLGRQGPHDLESFVRVIQVNLIGTFNSVRLAAAAMAQNSPDDEGQRGVIVNTASVAAFEGQVGQAAYSASKGAVAAMTLPLARELAEHGIRVVAIAPGIFDTPMMAGLPEKARASLSQQVPFPPRLGRPDEYAALVQHVIENPMINGAVIRLDGALRMGPR